MERVLGSMGSIVAVSYQSRDLHRLDRLFLLEVCHLRDRLKSSDATRVFAVFDSVWQSAQTGSGCEEGGWSF